MSINVKNIEAYLPLYKYPNKDDMNNELVQIIARQIIENFDKLPIHKIEYGDVSNLLYKISINLISDGELKRLRETDRFYKDYRRRLSMEY